MFDSGKFATMVVTFLGTQRRREVEIATSKLACTCRRWLRQVATSRGELKK